MNKPPAVIIALLSCITAFLAHKTHILRTELNLALSESIPAEWPHIISDYDMRVGNAGVGVNFAEKEMVSGENGVLFMQIHFNFNLLNLSDEANKMILSDIFVNTLFWLRSPMRDYKKIICHWVDRHSNLVHAKEFYVREYGSSPAMLESA